MAKRCPRCGSRNIEKHGIDISDFNWWLCRDCGWNWDEEQEADDE